MEILLSAMNGLGSFNNDDYIVGKNWYTDIKYEKSFEDKWQGAATIRKLCKEILEDWAERGDA